MEVAEQAFVGGRRFFSEESRRSAGQRVKGGGRLNLVSERSDRSLEECGGRDLRVCADGEGIRSASCADELTTRLRPAQWPAIEEIVASGYTGCRQGRCT